MSTAPCCVEEAEEEEDISALEYARLSGLSRNHLTEPFPPFPIPDFRDFGDSLTSDSHLRQLDLRASYSTDERLTISKDGARLIAWVSNPEPDELIDDIVRSMLGGREFRMMRLELPLLRSDHEIDCREFARREGFEVELENVRLPLELLDEEKNEGLGFSPRLWNLGAEKIEELKREKISVTRETLQYIQDAIRLDWTEANEKEVRSSILKYKPNTALDPVTPPLSPISSSPKIYEPSPSDPAFQVPILSDPASLTREDLSALEKHIFEQDVPTPIRNAVNNYDETSSCTYTGSETVRLADVYSPMASVENTLASPITDTSHVRREFLKVEETLTPLIPASIPKSVHFSDFIEEMLLDPSSSPPSDPFQNTHFEKLFGDAAKRATRQVEQETLIAADATARVEVPVMDFSLPDPPWKQLQKHQSPAIFLSILKAIINENAIGKELPTWPGWKHGEIKLKWNPFPHGLAQVAQQEKYPEDDSVWKVLVEGPGDDQIIDTSTLTWKPPGLRILKDDEDEEEEIEKGKFRREDVQNISSLVKKRRMEFEEERDNPLGQEPIQLKKHGLDTADEIAARPAGRQGTPKKRSIQEAEKLQDDQVDSEGFGLLMGGVFSAGNALDAFLELRGTKKPKLTSSSHFAKPPQQAQTQAQTTQAGLQHQSAMQHPMRKSPVTKPDLLPAPPLHLPTAPISAVVSSALLKRRALIKHLESQLPGLTLIERDFTAHNTTAWLPHSVTRSPIASPLDSEADLIVSPSMGIILTTLQKIKQKALPGQKTKPAIRDRLEKVSARYDKLVVLVSEARGDESTNGLDENDCKAFSEFVAFALGLEMVVLVRFVGGGEETMAKWLVSCIVQHAATANSLLEEETHWELFLRRAGLNAFAAQVIIAAVKAPKGVDPRSPSKAGQFGLTAFVEMGREQRIESFGQLCGRRLMERVSSVLDARWE